MSTARRLFKNTLILMAAYGLQPVISFYLIIVISREMGVAGLGIYRTIFNYVAVFQIIAAFGLKNLLTREIARDRQNAQKILISGSYISVAFGAVSAVLMVGVALLLSNQQQVHQGVLLAAVSLIAAALSDTYEGLLAGFEELSRVGYAWLGENFVRVAISIALVYAGYGVLSLVVVYVITRFLKSLFYAYYISRKFVRPIGPPRWAHMAHIALQARTFALIMVCVTIYWKADVIMLEALRSAEDVGIYSAAYSFLLISIILVDSFVNSLFPVLANFYSDARKKFNLAFTKALKLVALGALPVSIGLALRADEIIQMIYGSKFALSAGVLQILIWTIVPYAVSQVLAYALVASLNQRLDLIVNFAAMLLNIGLNFFLIPRYAFIGASVATLISIHAYVALQIPFIHQKVMKIKPAPLLGMAARMVAAGAAMGWIVVQMKSANWILAVGLGTVGYLAVLTLLGGIQIAEVKEGWQMVRGRPRANEAVAGGK